MRTLVIAALLFAAISCVDPYKILDVAETASEKEISAAYMRLTKKYKKHEHIQKLVEEAYEEIIAERSNEAVEIDTNNQQEAKLQAQRHYQAGARYRGRYRRGFRSPMVNLAKAAFSTATTDPAPTAERTTPKEVTETQAQNISIAKLIVSLINLLLKVVPIGLVIWFCVRPQWMRQPQRPDQLRRNM